MLWTLDKEMLLDGVINLTWKDNIGWNTALPMGYGKNI